MQGTEGKRKTFKKSEVFSKHGKHKGVMVQAVVQNREHRLTKKKRDALKEPMFPTVKEAMAAARRK